MPYAFAPRMPQQPRAFAAQVPLGAFPRLGRGLGGLPRGSTGAAYIGSMVFTAIAAGTSFTVPATASQVLVKAWGSAGAAGVYSNNGYSWGNSGGGGFAQGVIDVTGGETLLRYVGGAANNGGAANDGYGGRGGGFSGLARSTTPLILAGGGGGGAVNTPQDGGAGGGESGQTGTAGQGGGQTNAWTTTATSYGGGGYQPGTTGSGGSGYVPANARQRSLITSLWLAAANSSDVDYPAGNSPGGRPVGLGANGPQRSGYDGTGGYGSGHLVLHFFGAGSTVARPSSLTLL